MRQQQKFWEPCYIIQLSCSLLLFLHRFQHNPQLNPLPSTQPSTQPSTLPPTQHGADNKPKTASETDYFYKKTKIIQIVPILITTLLKLCILLYQFW
jgi:hypothetical protein